MANRIAHSLNAMTVASALSFNVTCYLCGALKGDPMIPACGVLRCPMKEHAAQRAPSVAAPIIAAPQENQARDRGIDTGFLAPSSGSLPNTSGPAGAAPTPEEIAFNEVGLDEDPDYRRAKYEYLRGERRR